MHQKVMGAFILILIAISANAAFSAASCPNLSENKVKPEDIKIIVNKHNQLRSLIANGKVIKQPKGVNVGSLKWDPVLAKEAQKIANTCVFAHVKVNDPRWYVGQNLATSASTAKTANTDWSGVIQRWFNEHKDFIYPSTSNGVTGHYTQVIWADTKYVGCGYTSWFSGGWYKKLYVCNYGPGGNIIGQAPYRTR